MPIEFTPAFNRAVFPYGNRDVARSPVYLCEHPVKRIALPIEVATPAFDRATCL